MRRDPFLNRLFIVFDRLAAWLWLVLIIGALLWSATWQNGFTYSGDEAIRLFLRFATGKADRATSIIGIGLSFLADLDREARGFSVELVCVSRLGNTELHEECAANYKHRNVTVGDLGGTEFERSLWFRIPLRDEQGRYPRLEISKDEIVGHGLVVQRKMLPGTGSPQDGISEVWSDVLPAYETAPTTADLQTIINGELKRIRVSMRKLAGLDATYSGLEELEELVAAYEKWINELEVFRPGVPPIPVGQQDTADHLIARCRHCLSRIRDGLDLAELLDDDEPRSLPTDLQETGHKTL